MKELIGIANMHALNFSNIGIGFSIKFEGEMTLKIFIQMFLVN